MDLPEDKLQQQAALSRATRAEQKIVPSSRATDAIVVGFDADKGQDIIQLSDGSIRYATPITNGVRNVGDTVLLHQSSNRAYSDALPHIKSRVSSSPRKVPQTTYPFKVLFSVVEDGVRKFYVGGDRTSPTKISLPSISDGLGFAAYICNTGRKKDDWIVSIYLPTLGIYSITSESCFFHSNDKFNVKAGIRNFLEYVGGGCFRLASNPIDSYVVTNYFVYKDSVDTFVTTVPPTTFYAGVFVFPGLFSRIYYTTLLNSDRSAGISRFGLPRLSPCFVKLDLSAQPLDSLPFNTSEDSLNFTSFVKNTVYQVSIDERVKTKLVNFYVRAYVINSSTTIEEKIVAAPTLPLKVENAIIHAVSYFPPNLH